MNWPHGPTHWLFEPGTYIVTAGTYQKLPHLHSPLRRDFFLKSLFDYAIEFQWNLRAWAVLANHYHVVAASSEPAKSLGQHARSKGVVSVLGEPYVHYNPAKHGVTPLAENYRWCSASWFIQNASPAFVNTVKNFKTDRVNVPDDF
jgi:hypothetical protein